MVKTDVIDDFISLGRAAPDKLSGGRKSYCVGGYSLSKGFIRIYPTSYNCPFKRWNPLKIPVEKNLQDTREESWKIQGSKEEWDRLEQKIQVLHKRDSFLPKSQRRSFINHLATTCISDLNERQVSLGIIKPESINGVFNERKDVKKELQIPLWEILGIEKPADHFIQTKKEYTHIPMIRYTCSGCTTKQGYHEQQLLNIEAYEWMRKHPDNLDQFWTNLHFNDNEWDVYLFVGNQARHRKSFMVISVLRFKKSKYELIEWIKPKKKPKKTNLIDFL